MKSTSSARALTVTAVTLALAACGGDGAAGGDTVIPLEPTVGPGSGGEVRLAAAGSRTRVEVRTTKAAPVPQPAHVHAGTCDDFDPLPAYSLSSVESGFSATLLPIELDDLRSQTFVVNIHKSAAEMRVTVACTEIG